MEDEQQAFCLGMCDWTDSPTLFSCPCLASPAPLSLRLASPTPTLAV